MCAVRNKLLCVGHKAGKSRGIFLMMSALLPSAFGGLTANMCTASWRPHPPLRVEPASSTGEYVLFLDAAEEGGSDWGGIVG